MYLQLENKTAWISGSTKEIGFAIARLLAAEADAAPEELEGLNASLRRMMRSLPRLCRG